MPHKKFVTTSRGLRRGSPPMRLYEKAKRLGVWNPSEIDFSQDVRDWARLNADERDMILRLTAMFAAGEEAVTRTLLPLIWAVSLEGRLEEEIYLSTFLYEEAKHTDFFQRVLEDVVGAAGDLRAYHSENYRSIFYEALPQALNQLYENPYPENQLRAAVTYNMIVEGVLAETGYKAFSTMLARNDLMPGLQKGIYKLRQDESRHIAYGIYLISRLVAVDDGLWASLEETMNALLVPASGIIAEAFACYDPVPFDLLEDEFVDYALDQFNKRFMRLERARGRSLEEIEGTAMDVIDANES